MTFSIFLKIIESPLVYTIDDFQFRWLEKQDYRNRKGNISRFDVQRSKLEIV